MVGKASPIGFVSSQTVSFLRQFFYLFANVRASSPIFLSLHQCICVFANVFVSPPMFLSLRQWFRVFDHCLCFFANGFCLFIDHGSEASDQGLRVCYRSRIWYRFSAVQHAWKWVSRVVQVVALKANRRSVGTLRNSTFCGSCPFSKQPLMRLWRTRWRMKI